MSVEDVNDPYLTIYNLEWTKSLVSGYLQENSIGTAFELAGKEILNRSGYANIHKASKGEGFDFHAEKEGQMYAIEIKGTVSGGDVVIRWHQLMKMFTHTLTGSALLMFINAGGEWSTYEIVDGYHGSKTN